MQKFSIVLLIFLSSFFSISQVITVEFEKTKFFISEGRISPEDLLLDTSSMYASEPSKYKKVFDLDSNICKFYINDSLQSSLNISKVEKIEGNLIKLTFIEQDLRDGFPLVTHQFVSDTICYYYWYWGGQDNLSNLILEEVSNISIK